MIEMGGALDRLKNLDRRDLKFVTAFIIVPIAISLLLLVLVFRSYGEEEDIAVGRYLSQPYAISKQEFDKVVRKVKSINQEKISTKYAEPRKAISFNSATPKEVQELNKHIYQITEHYFNPSLMTNLPENFVDPLIMLAMSNVEKGSDANTEILYSAVIPSIYLGPVSTDLIDTFGIANLQSMSSYWNSTGDWGTLGPLQMTKDYGVENAAIRKDLKSNERERLIVALNNNPAPGYIQTGYIDSTDGNGDRFNWADAVNRTSGELNYAYGQYLSNTNIKKDGDNSIENPYSFLALMAMAHNNGTAVLLNSDKVSSPDPYWAWGSAEHARWYSHDLGSDEAVDYIRAKAEESINSLRTGQSTKLSFRIGNDTAQEWIRDMVNSGIISSKSLETIQGSNAWIHADYPVQALYAYSMLDMLYTGK